MTTTLISGIKTKVKVCYLSSVRVALAKREEEIGINDNATLLDLLTKLAEKYGKKFEKKRLNLADCSRARCMATVNGVLMSQPQGIHTKLKPSNTIASIPIISGGILGGRGPVCQ